MLGIGLSAVLYTSARHEAAGVRPAQAGPAWKVVHTEKLHGLTVSLSQPVLVARSRGYLWFPTLPRLSGGELLAVMSNYAASPSPWRHSRALPTPPARSKGTAQPPKRAQETISPS